MWKEEPALETRAGSFLWFFTEYRETLRGFSGRSRRRRGSHMPSVEDLDLAIDALQQTRMEWVPAVIDHAVNPLGELAGEQLQRREPTRHGASIPVLPETASCRGIAKAPELLQVILET